MHDLFIETRNRARAAVIIRGIFPTCQGRKMRKEEPEFLGIKEKVLVECAIRCPEEHSQVECLRIEMMVRYLCKPVFRVLVSVSEVKADQVTTLLQGRGCKS